MVYEKKTIISKTNIWTPTHLYIQDIVSYILLIFVNIINYFLSTLSDTIVGKWYSASSFGKGMIVTISFYVSSIYVYTITIRH